MGEPIDDRPKRGRGHRLLRLADSRGIFRSTTKRKRYEDSGSLAFVFQIQKREFGVLHRVEEVLQLRRDKQSLISGLLQNRIGGFDDLALLRRAIEAGVSESHIIEQENVGDELIHRLCYQRRAGLVAWDIGIEAGRLATDWGRSTTGRTRNGLSLILSTLEGESTDRQPELRNGETENVFNPRIQLLSLGADRALTSYSTPKNLDKGDRKGSRRIISLKPMAESLSGSSLDSPRAAADLWELDTGIPEEPYTDLSQAFFDLNLLGELTHVLFLEHRQLQSSPPGTATSPGSYARGLFESMGLTPPLVQHADFPRPVLAAAMGAYFSGDVFTHARSRQLPIHKLDLGSAYSVAYHLTDSWGLYSAKTIRVFDRDPDPVATYVETLARRVRRWWETRLRSRSPPRIGGGWREPSSASYPTTTGSHTAPANAARRHKPLRCWSDPSPAREPCPTCYPTYWSRRSGPAESPRLSRRYV